MKLAAGVQLPPLGERTIPMQTSRIALPLVLVLCLATSGCSMTFRDKTYECPETALTGQLSNANGSTLR